MPIELQLRVPDDVVDQEITMKICSYCGRKNETSSINCAECGTELPAESQPAQTPAPKPTAVCPRCGTADNFRPALALRSSFNWIVFICGGWMAVMFQNASQEKRVQCNSCGEFFGVRSPMSKLWRVLFWILVAPGLLILSFVLISVLFRK